MKKKHLLGMLAAAAIAGQVQAQSAPAAAGPPAQPPSGELTETIAIEVDDLPSISSNDLIRELERAGGSVTRDQFGHAGTKVVIEPQQLRTALDRLLRQRDLAPADIPLLETDSSSWFTEEMRARRSWYQQTVGGAEAATGIRAEYSSQLRNCGTNLSCRAEVESRFPNIDQVASRLESLPPACGTASSRYAAVLRAIRQQGRTQTLLRMRDTAARALDNACMAAPWDVDAPAVAQAGGAAAPGALEATALISLDSHSAPFCAGLFLKPDEVLTALHCFNERSSYDALRNGTLVVRQVGTGRERPQLQDRLWNATAVVLPPPSLVGRQDIPVREDSIRLRIAGGPPSVPRIVMARAPGLSPLFVPGYLIGHDPERKPAVSEADWISTPAWWKGLRWAKKDMCLVADVVSDCLRMMCQTTGGYSGAPVFALDRDRTGALVLHGIVKGTDGANLCRPTALSYSTVGLVLAQ